MRDLEEGRFSQSVGCDLSSLLTFRAFVIDDRPSRNAQLTRDFLALLLFLTRSFRLGTGATADLIVVGQGSVPDALGLRKTEYPSQTV